MPLVRALGVGTLALATLAAAMPAETSPTAEQPLVFDGTDGAALDGRDERVAGRSQVRGETPTPEVRDAVGQAFEAPLPEVTGQQWATTAVNVRSGPSAEDEQVTTLAWADPVDVTGETRDGWTQIIWNDEVAWVSSDYLAEDEPVAEEPEDQGVSSAACAT
ncbi:SH3 domain-containing protein, partial [Pseudactinotalea sp.]|uniref:SH3 domain-containing protein n=1 Tax=Pseudactinotalea sp. TaxID=1926260 RepID=UPI003B3B52CA